MTINLVDFIGKIRDPLHNTIPFSRWEKIIMDMPEFQRLRRIRQTSFIHYVFPGATHSRFSHSLGAMHIAWKMFCALVDNQQQILKSQNAHPSLLQTVNALTTLKHEPYLVQCLRFAALLHDCGHSALSHSGEKFMHTGTNHEHYSLLVIKRLFQGTGHTHEGTNHPWIGPQMGQDVCAVLDLSQSPSAEGPLAKSGLQTLLHEIVSGEVDADRMDYLRRDSLHCGVVYGHFDLERILDSLVFYCDETTQNMHLAIRKQGLFAFEDYLHARLSMYGQVYFHKTATACEAMLEHIRHHLQDPHLPAQLDEYLAIDDQSFLHFMMAKIENSPDKNYLSTLAYDLMHHRKLWKRIYEERIPPDHKSTAFPSHSAEIVKKLQSLDIPVEIIDSKKNLTRFLPKGKDSQKINKFKVVLKNIHSFHNLVPIEEHSSLINRPENITIRRVFVAPYKKDGTPTPMELVQDVVAKK